MPYIKKEDRAEIDPLIEPVIQFLLTQPPEKVDGEINYIVTKVLKKLYPLKYYHINRAMGVLECIKQEYYRRVAAGYEDQKARENGDA